MKSFPILTVALLAAGSVSRAEDWPQWGGNDPGRNMYSTAKGLPESFNPGKLKSGTAFDTTAFGALSSSRELARVRNARQGGDPVVFGDSADPDMLQAVGLQNASAIVITFASPAISLGIIRAVRALRPELPLLVRTQDDTKLAELGAIIRRV